MQLGFSLPGVIYLAMLFIPNIIWAKRQPAGYTELSQRENRTLLALERAGQVAATCSAVIFTSPRGYSLPWLAWLIAALIMMLLYEIAWTRYFVRGCRLTDMYAALGPIPIPLASLPVAALLLLGIWCQSPVIIASALILGIGHIGIHLGHLRELSER